MQNGWLSMAAPHSALCWYLGGTTHSFNTHLLSIYSVHGEKYKDKDETVHFPPKCFACEVL